ncbi:class-II fumarase/aspartase family protein [Shimia thalassica]|uniref:class-II fumarase/aspartase family protein n=1 Tax=Shimia thalassica TaxID=1715693 RepID=UPI0027340AE2|nr:adenylosuccinate lyase family protein [Shimia thalassica]MDP2519088.1 adenylosuccinate lyase family protein [Shimia thalassica]
MAASVFDSPLFSRLFPTGEAGRLFTDTAEVRAMLLVEGTLAKVQGEMGIIPQDSAFFIHRAAMEVQIDPAGLADETGQNGVNVPGLVAAFRKAMEAPEHAQFIHWGATSQDIIDTGLMLRLRSLLTLAEKDLQSCLSTLAKLAETHAETPMVGRTWGQAATLTSFGAQAAEWGNPLVNLLAELAELRTSCLLVSLSGASGTSGAYGPKAAELRAALATSLNLQNPDRSWHTDRTPILRIANWLGRVNVALGKLGEDLIAMSMTGIGEIDLGGGGSSSTMPQKQNPVAASALVALAHQGNGLQATLNGAAMQKHQRDAAAWFTEWLCLPQICLGAISALGIATKLLPALSPRAEEMAKAAQDPLDLIHAEALSFALSETLRRPDAQAATKSMCKEANASGTPLSQLVARDYPDLDVSAVFDPLQQMGLAPRDARAFAQRATKVTG